MRRTDLGYADDHNKEREWMLQSDDMWYKTEYKAGKGERGRRKNGLKYQ